MIETHESLTDSMQALVDKGQDVTLSALSNTMAGVGYDVQALVRYGLWELKEIHRGPREVFDTYRYGPIA